MGMLDRIKKRQIAGFKEFVINLETTSTVSRGQIFTAGVLEDPVFMNYVMKNIKTFDDFLQLDTDDIDTVLNSQDRIMGVLAKCVFDFTPEKRAELEANFPRLASKLKDELSYLTAVTPQESSGAKYFIMKVARKLQMDERIRGFAWHMPPMDVFYPKVMKDGKAQVHFESGVIAAEGLYLKGKREGPWKHNYDMGNILAEGDYMDGLKAGIWSFYYSNGKMKSQGKYKADLKHGQWKEWDRNGTLNEVEYNEGVKK